MGFITPSWLRDDGPCTTCLAVTAAGATIIAIVAFALAASRTDSKSVVRSPLNAILPKLSKEEFDKLPYKPDHFPGARDVDTPYGSMRVYEWGPETGAKVLFIHGISTSCQTLGKLAHGLVSQGYRVLLFDLWGRGFSDGVDDLPHDARLYTSQALIALSSSCLSWTGDRSLHLIGYSLGGGVAAHIAASLPNLVASLVMLAPAGLIDPAQFGRASRVVFLSGLVPRTLLLRLTAWRLRRPLASARRDAVVAQTAEARDPADDRETETPLNKCVMAYVPWMIANHPGFVPAFLSCMRHAPITGQEATWRKLGHRPRGATIVVLAEEDTIIDAGDYTARGLPLLGGRDHVLWQIIPGGHDFVMTHAEEILVILRNAWVST